MPRAAGRWRRTVRTLARRLAPGQSTAVPPREARTVAQGWEAYAQRISEQGERVGDAWSRPDQMGIDVERAEDVVPYLDEVLFAPFFGHCEIMLEIGAGGGRFTEVLLPKCDKLIAVDTSPTMLELLSERLRNHPRLECRLVDGSGLAEIQSSSVDAAFSYGVFVHLQHWDIYNYLAELHRVLKPGGKALIQHSNTFSELGWTKFAREVAAQLNTHKLPYTFTVNTPELMAAFAERAGLETLDLVTDIVRRDCIALLRRPPSDE